MKSENIFIGTIKKCKNLYWYNQYGDESYVGDFKIGRTEIGTIHRYVDIVDEQAILIKVNENKYIWLNLLTNKTDEFLVNLGIPIKTISTIPSNDNPLFVDKETLRPCLKKEKKLSVKKVKALLRTTKN